MSVSPDDLGPERLGRTGRRRPAHRRPDLGNGRVCRRRRTAHTRWRFDDGLSLRRPRACSSRSAVRGSPGSPSTQADHVEAVGPATWSGSPSLASNTVGLLQGIGYGNGPSSSTSSGDAVPRAQVRVGPRAGVVAAELRQRREWSHEANARDEARRRPRRDRRRRRPDLAPGNTAKRGSWRSPLRGRGVRSPTLPAPPRAIPLGRTPRPRRSPVADGRPRLLGRDETRPNSGRVEHAQIGAPLAVGLAAVLITLRSSNPSFLRWLRSGKSCRAAAPTHRTPPRVSYSQPAV